jgi:hypothetical protein
MEPRFRARRRVTDSGRARIWFVEDTTNRVKDAWLFKSGTPLENEVNARSMARLLNMGYRFHSAKLKDDET